MASIRPATRYANGRSSPADSGASSSSDFTPPGDLATKNDSGKINIGFMVKKLVDSKRANKNTKFVIAPDILAENLKKTAKKGSGLGELDKKALTEVKGNTRTLAMVLRSERELLSKNKEQEEQIGELKLQLEEKSREVEKLKDLCLKQREEIKSLKSAILFPDTVNSQLQDTVERRGCELNQAKQLIPSLQKQVISLTGQLRCLAKDLAEMKAEKYAGRGTCHHRKMASYYESDDVNSPVKAFSLGDYYTTPRCPDDDMFLKDLNPCLTPYKIESGQFDGCEDTPGECRSNRSNISDTSEAELSRSFNCSITWKRNAPQ